MRGQLVDRVVQIDAVQDVASPHRGPLHGVLIVRNPSPYARTDRLCGQPLLELVEVDAHARRGVLQAVPYVRRPVRELVVVVAGHARLLVLPARQAHPAHDVVAALVALDQALADHAGDKHRDQVQVLPVQVSLIQEPPGLTLARARVNEVAGLGQKIVQRRVVDRQDQQPTEVRQASLHLAVDRTERGNCKVRVELTPAVDRGLVLGAHLVRLPAPLAVRRVTRESARHELSASAGALREGAEED